MACVRILTDSEGAGGGTAEGDIPEWGRTGD